MQKANASDKTYIVRVAFHQWFLFRLFRRTNYVGLEIDAPDVVQAIARTQISIELLRRAAEMIDAEAEVMVAYEKP